MKIVIVEDEPKLAAVMQQYLQRDNFDTEHYADGTEALSALLRDPPDLVLLDLMLPGTDGMTICRELRAVSTVPIIMVTARVEEIDRLLGLEIGADDYICKPFSPREVVARVKAVLRRYSAAATTPADAPDSTALTLDEERAHVSFNNTSCSLTAVELELLKNMMGSPGRIFSRTQLMQRIYPDNRIVSDRTIDSHVKKLRQKLAQLGSSDDFIHSVYGIGYKFEE